MLAIKAVVLLWLVVFLMACSPIAVKHTGGHEKNPTAWRTLSEIKQGGYYALIEKQGADWRIVQLSIEPMTHRQNSQQDIIWISDALNEILLVFSVVNEWDEGSHSFICFGSNDVSVLESSCGSQLIEDVEGPLLAGLFSEKVAAAKRAEGEKPYVHKNVSQDKLSNALERTDLLSVIKQIQTHRHNLHEKYNDIVEAYKRYGEESVTINIKLQDESGYFRKGDLKTVTTIQARTLAPPSSLFLESGNILEGYLRSGLPLTAFLKETYTNQEAELRSFEYREMQSYEITCKSEESVSYDIVFLCPSSIKRSAEAKTETVTMIVKSLTLDSPFPVYQGEDNNIKIHSDGEFFTIENVTEKPILISSLAIRYRSELSTRKGWTLELAPNSISKPKTLANFLAANVKQSARISGITKKIASDITVNLGFAIKYIVGSNRFKNSFYDVTTASLDSIIKEQQERALRLASAKE